MRGISGSAVAVEADGIGWEEVSHDPRPIPVPSVTQAVGPLAGEVRVNSFTTGAQLNPTIAVLTGGGYVVAWTSEGQDGSGDGVYAQRYNADGTLAGAEFRIATTTASDQRTPSLAALPDGGFVATWQGRVAGVNGYDIYGQRYDAAGVVQGSQFMINTTTASFQGSSSVAGFPGGGFVVTWQSLGAGETSDVYARRYNADGSPASGEFRVNTYLTANQDEASVAALANGGFVVTWQSDGQDGAGRGVYGQRYDATGAPVGVEFRASTTTAGAQQGPAITALDGGGFVIVWGGDALRGQIYGADGIPVGSEFAIAAGFTGVAVTALIGGGFAVSWDDFSISGSGDGAGYGVVARAFSPTGTPLGETFVVNQTSAGDQRTGGPGSLATLADGSVAFVWAGAGTGDTSGVFLRRFDVGGEPGEAGPIVGTSGPDTLTGTAGDDVLRGNGGNDAIDGLGGSDIAEYGGAQADYRVTLSGGVYTIDDLRTGRPDGTDTLRNVEFLRFGSGDPVAIADALSPVTPPGGPTPIGGDVLVLDEFGVPLVAALTGGGYALAYAFSVSGTITGFQTQAFTNDGTPLGEPVYLGLFELSGSDNDPSIAALSGGGYVLGWVGQDADDESINPALFQRFDATGQPVGPRVTLSADAGGFDTKIAAAPDGGFFVLWGAEATEGMFGQRYDAQGNAVGAQIDFPQFTSREPSVKFLSNGNLAIAWAPLVGPLELAIYSPAGTLLTVSASQNAGRSPQIAVLENGGFVVAWEVQGDIMAQLFDDQAVAQGAVFRVNSDAVGDRDYPSIHALADGGFIVSWESSLQDGDPFDLYARQFAADGQPVGDEFIVNATREGMQRGDFDNVTQLTNGDLLFTWWIEDGPDAGIYLRRFEVSDAPGDGGDVPPPLGGETKVAIGEVPLIVALEGGGYVVAAPYGANGDISFQFQLFAADGTPIGASVQLGSFEFDSEENYPSIAALTGGGFVIGWSMEDTTGTGSSAVFRQFNADGSAAGPLVTVSPDGSSYDVAVAAAPDGGYVVLFGNSGQSGMIAQRYSATGSPVGNPIPLPALGQSEPSASFLANGNLAIAYDPPSGNLGVLIYSPAGVQLHSGMSELAGRNLSAEALEGGAFVVTFVSGLFVYAQLFDSQANAQGAAFRVSAATASGEDFPTVRALSNGGFVVTWEAEGGNGSGVDLYARLFDASGQPTSDEFIVNETLAGDQRADFVNVDQLANGDLIFAWYGAGVDGFGIYTRRFELDGSGNVATPTPGNDDLAGTPGADLFDLSAGGDDSVDGGAGDDGFFFGGAYTGADVVDGGAGSLDQIGLQGDYSGGVTLGSLLNTELVVLLPGNDARFGGETGTNLSYVINVDGGTVVSDNKLIIQANLLRAGEGLTFNGGGSAIDFLIYGGLGTDNLTGGSGDDGFFFGQGRFGTSDVVNGGAGTMDQLGLQGNFTITFGAAQISGIEFIVLLSASDNRFGAGGGTASYDLTMNDGNVAAGQRLIVSANTLTATETLEFRGFFENNGSFQIFSGAGDDFIAGSQNADDIRGGAGDDFIEGQGGADLLRGGAGNDTFHYLQASHSTNAARDQILDFALGDTIDFTGLAANTGGGSFSFIGSGAPTGARQVQVTQTGNQATVNVFIDGDATADMVIDVTVIDGHTLTAADFAAVTGQQPLPAKATAPSEADGPLVMELVGPDMLDLGALGGPDGSAAPATGDPARYLDIAFARDFAGPDVAVPLREFDVASLTHDLAM